MPADHGPQGKRWVHWALRGISGGLRILSDYIGSELIEPARDDCFAMAWLSRELLRLSKAEQGPIGPQEPKPYNWL